MADDGLLEFFVGALIVATLAAAVLNGGVFGTDASTDTTATVLTADGNGQLDLPALATVESLTSVQTTLGDAASFDGDGSLFTDVPDVIGPGEWTICTHAAASSAVVSSDGTRTLLAVDGSVLRYNGSTDQYVVYYWNESSRTTQRAAVSISETDATQLQPICVVHDSGAFTVHTRTQESPTVSGTADNAQMPGSTTGWDGVVEETRLYGRALDSQNQTRYGDDPTQALPGPAPAARLTYDTRDSDLSSLPVYFAGSTATADNVTRVDGATGPTLSEGSDYRRVGDAVAVLDGGVLEPTGEVLYVDYRQGDNFGFFARLGVVLFVFGVVTVKLLGVME